MSDIFKIKLSSILASCQFWLPTIVLYYQSQGLAVETIYLILTIYSLSALLFEYPTGVIADYFSPKISLIFGYFIQTLVFFLSTFHGPAIYYGVLFIFGAAGFTLTSGSNTALLHSVSKNFRHDFSQVKMYSLIMSVFSAIVGGLTIAINLSYAFYLTAFCFFLSGLLLLFTRTYPYERLNGNIFKGGLIGLHYVKGNVQLFYLIFIGSLIGGFFMSFKFFYAPLFTAMKLTETSWGVYIALATLCSALGVHLFKKYASLNARILTGCLLMAFLLVGFVVHPLIALLGLFLCFLLRGYLEARIDIDVNETITSHARASILSLDSFLTRLLSTGFTFILGMLVAKVPFSTIMIGTTLSLIFIGIYPFIKLKKL